MNNREFFSLLFFFLYKEKFKCKITEGGNVKTYVGIKIVKAEPMTREEACKESLVRENECDKPNGDGYMVIYENGYASWSPKDVFDKHYKLIKE